MLVHQHGAVGGAQHLCRQLNACRTLVAQRQHGAHLAADIRLVIDGIYEQHGAAACGFPQLFRQWASVGFIYNIRFLRRPQDLLRRKRINITRVFTRLHRLHLLDGAAERRFLHLLQHHAAPVQPFEYFIGQLHGLSPYFSGVFLF